MEIIGLIGIIVGVAVFIYCCAKNVNTLIASSIGSLIIIVTSGTNILEGITSTWAGGFSGFIKAYFLLFALGSLFGKCLAESGASRRIAIGIYRICAKNKKNPRFAAALFVPIMYMITSYVGVSGFVVVYTVLDIAKHVYYKANVPWRMFTYGGATFLVTMLLPGNLQLVNVAAAKFCGTTVSSGVLMGFLGGGLCCVLNFAIIYWDVKRSEKNGEGFMETGAAFVASDPDLGKGDIDDDTSSLPSLLQAWTPMIVMIVLAAIVRLDIIICVAVGILLCFVVMPGRIQNPMTAITQGVTNCFGPIIGVAAASAVGTCLKVSVGYNIITNSVSLLPDVIGGCVMIAVMSFCAASSTGGLNPLGADVFAIFTNAGLSPAVSHRLMTLSVFTSVPPQSAGIVNTSNICKIEYKKSVWNYMRLQYISGLITFIVLVSLVQFGVFT